MRRWILLVLVSFVLVGCGASAEEKILGKWDYTWTNKSYTTTFTPNHVHFIEGSRGFQCWAFKDGKLHIYARRAEKGIDGGRPWELKWDGDESFLATAGGDEIKYIRASSNSELTSQAKLLVVEQMLDGEEGGMCQQ